MNEAKQLTVAQPQSAPIAEYNAEQLNLIRNTVAKRATNDEFALFMYRAKNMGLDPLKPGQIYFVKYNDSSPGTIVVGIDGFRSRAERTGKRSGTKRGVMRDEKGKCVGAWAEVYRHDWKEPAREEVALHEYNTGKSQWSKMPETMIKKVAECAALRIAFPDELGGVYAPEEMDQANHAQDKADTLHAMVEPKPVQQVATDMEITFGTLAGRNVNDLTLAELKDSVNYWHNRAAKEKRALNGKVLEVVTAMEARLGGSVGNVTTPSDEEMPY